MFENDEDDVNLKATELKLGLPGRDEETEQQSSSSGKSNKRSMPEVDNSGQKDASHRELHGGAPPPPKGQVVGWPPVRAYRKNALQQQQSQNETNISSETATGMYVKVSMDGAPYLRKIDLKFYKNYFDLVKALEGMFNCTIGKQGADEYAPTYEDKDGDWMLVGDVPWEMFASSCKRMRIMKGSEAQGLV